MNPLARQLAQENNMATFLIQRVIQKRCNCDNPFKQVMIETYFQLLKLHKSSIDFICSYLCKNIKIPNSVLYVLFSVT